MNKYSILEPVTALLPVKKDTFISTLPNMQSLTSPPVEAVNVLSKTATAVETEKPGKEKEVDQQRALSKSNVQNSQNISDVNQSI